MDPTAAVISQVRATILAQAIDPLREPDRVRGLIAAAAADLAPSRLSASNSIIAEAWAALAGFGPLQQWMDDPEIEEIWINEPGRVFVAREGVSSLTPLVLTAEQVRDLVERMLRLSGRRVDLSSPFVDALLPDGSRLHVAIPDVTRRHWAVNIRRFVVRAKNLRDLVAREALTAEAADYLEAAVADGQSIVVSGGTQAGKTTMLGALLGCVPTRERIVSCEEVFELRIEHPDWVAMQARDASLEGTGEIPLRRLVREALRMRPTRLVVGEVRQAEALDLLIAMNSGMPCMATLHANSAREALTKLCTLPLIAGPNISSDFVRPTVASAVGLVVQVRSDREGKRSVSEICKVTGRLQGPTIEVVDIFRDRGNGLVGDVCDSSIMAVA